ncbi:hypothetical protein [Glycomyces sp. NPDC021274]|uniref:hypothetical protein n=1 Tax=Glycomyces sp. NPDC021274 TaxID=3155120 RepID=UPI0033F7C4F3
MNDLTPAEQAAAEAIQNFCSHTGPSTDPASLCGECDELARAAVTAARPLVAAQALAWVAASPNRWEGYCCHDHMAGVVMKAATEIKAGLDTVEDAAAEAALEDYFRWEVARRLKDERDLITDHADDLEYSRRRIRSRLKARIEGLREAAGMLTTAIDDLSRPTSEEH